MNRKLVVSPDAEQDLAFIFESSASQWGFVVAMEYLAKIDETMEYMADHGENGTQLAGTRYFSYLVQKKPKSFGHRILYRLTDSTLTVVALFHSQTPTERLERWLSGLDPESEM